MLPLVRFWMDMNLVYLCLGTFIFVLNVIFTLSCRFIEHRGQPFGGCTTA